MIKLQLCCVCCIKEMVHSAHIGTAHDLSEQRIPPPREDTCHHAYVQAKQIPPLVSPQEIKRATAQCPHCYWSVLIKSALSLVNTDTMIIACQLVTSPLLLLSQCLANCLTLISFFSILLFVNQTRIIVKVPENVYQALCCYSQNFVFFKPETTQYLQYP